ncbi:MAG: type II secretion system protein GspG [Halobacteriovorax sp.]|nr:type II secretion system protein GspG [Halobacteriovorax sp.]|tara:strand:+ start:264 stop:779 length:516 start_codon:yes stop_codon:yes gene_type:complete
MLPQRSQNNSTFRNLVRSQRGFSLVEILVALTLLGIAGTFVAGKIFEQLHEGKVQAAKIQMNQFAERLQEFRRKCGTYPETEQGLEALVTKPTGGRECKNYPPDGFIGGSGMVPQDPWNNYYGYVNEGSKFNIVSYGADLMEGGEDEDKDIWFRPPAGSEQQGDSSEGAEF